MNKAEALALVGQPVEAWTASNGTYVGELLEVLPSRPWRGKVRITGVLSCATHYELRGGVCRRGFRAGEVIEVGNSSVKPAPGVQGTDYLTALQLAKTASERWYAQNPQGQYAWTHKATAEALALVIAAEKQRLTTGEWQLRKA